MILVNLRDYPGSSRYSNADMAALRSSNLTEQRQMLDARGVEVAAFLSWLIKTQNIPPISHEGGFGLLAWSWGNTITMSFLAQATKLANAEQETIGKYLRALVFFGTCSAWGR